MSHAARERRGGVAEAATGDRFSIAAAVGGPRGAAEAVLPGLAFVVVFTATRDLRLSLVLALAGAGLLVLARLVSRLPLTPALSGALGVGICAFSAGRTGDAADFYLPGFLINVVYAAVLLLSTVRWPRVGPVPVVGLVVGSLLGGASWRGDARLVRLYQRLTWLFAGMFLLRLAVQLPLYATEQVTALGAARLLMGVPLLAAVGWVTWLSLRRAGVTGGAGGATPAVTPEAPADDPGPPRSPPP